MKRGEIYRANLDPVVGSEQGGVRPVLIIQNDRGNLHSPTVIVAAITSRQRKAHLPIHVLLPALRSAAGLGGPAGAGAHAGKGAAGKISRLRAGQRDGTGGRGLGPVVGHEKRMTA